ncbi:MAG: PGF-CTERM sorting domain-containing protein [Halobacteriota archaeon]|nr:PGF-CTERM sorting domain-containing protein [Halobacteriota archaeon]
MGEISDGDQVIVSGLFRAADGTIIADDVSKALIFGIPGFEAVFGIIGLLAVAFILLRSR